MAHRYEYKNPHGIGYRVMSDNLERSLALEYKDKLSRLVREIRLGDMYRIGSRRAIVEMITGSYVLMRYSFGAHECFVWDDVYKIVNGTYKKGDNEDD